MKEKKNIFYLYLFFLSLFLYLLGFFFLFRSKQESISLNELKEWDLGVEKLTKQEKAKVEQILNNYPSPCVKRKSLLHCLAHEHVCVRLCESAVLTAIELAAQGKEEREIILFLNHVSGHWQHPHK